MKIRNGFVSNSSSSSYLINKTMITPEQINQIIDHLNVASTLKSTDEHYWDEGDYTQASACPYVQNEHSMLLLDGNVADNFPMGDFLDAIGIPPEAIETIRD